jgi:hypothetical protein
MMADFAEDTGDGLAVALIVLRATKATSSRACERYSGTGTSAG